MWNMDGWYYVDGLTQDCIISSDNTPEIIAVFHWAFNVFLVPIWRSSVSQQVSEVCKFKRDDAIFYAPRTITLAFLWKHPFSHLMWYDVPTALEGWPWWLHDTWNWVGTGCGVWPQPDKHTWQGQGKHGGEKNGSLMKQWNHSHCKHQYEKYLSDMKSDSLGIKAKCSWD